MRGLRCMGWTVASLVALVARGAEKEQGAGLILNGSGTLWRSFVEWKAPIILTEGGELRPLKAQQYFWMPAEDPTGAPLPSPPARPAPDGWAAPEFDDSDWTQTSGAQGPGYRPKDWQHPGFSMWSPGSPAEVHAVCSRARFRVSDPTKTGDLKLALQYQGGAIVSLNGREIARGHLPAGELGRDTLALPYPDGVYIGADGQAILGEPGAKTTPEQLAQYEQRIRRLEAKVPASLLRAGVNVLAVEVRRAPYNEVYMGAPKEYRGKNFREWPWPWPHGRLIEARLTAAAAAPGAITPNIGRPTGIQVWQPHPWATVTGVDYGDPCEALAPIRMAGFRNGAFTAQLAVGSTDAIVGLSAKATDLVAARGGRLPAACVVLRYPEPDGNRFDALLERAPAQVETRAMPGTGDKAALQPVWVTVRVPADAQPGEYRGTLRVEAQGLAAVEAPLHVMVHDWRLPDPAALTMHNNLWQSHESVAARYQVPLWSDRHFELMGKSLELTAPLANKFCNLHLVKGAFCIGNSESMVRWIDKGDGGYGHDFTLFDKYLDLHAKALGKPGVLLIDVCVSIHSSNRPKDGSNPIKVSRLDPASGQVEPMGQPPLTPATGVPFWKPVLDEARQRLEKRGWWDVALIGTASDSGPGKDEALTFKEIWPDKAWFFSGHPNVKTVGGGVAPVACLEWVWGAGRLWNPAGGEGFLGGPAYPAPWRNRGAVSVAFPRLGAGACELFMRSSLADYRLNPEKSMQSGMHGIGRVGMNFWEFVDANGRRRQLDFGQGTGQFYFNTAVPWLLGAGPDGPLPTTRSEMFREGLQVREAMTFLQQALESGKLAPPLAARIGDLLRQRAIDILREHGDGQRAWRENEERLFALCAEAAKAG